MANFRKHVRWNKKNNYNNYNSLHTKYQLYIVTVVAGAHPYNYTIYYIHILWGTGRYYYIVLLWLRRRAAPRIIIIYGSALHKRRPPADRVIKKLLKNMIICIRIQTGCSACVIRARHVIIITHDNIIITL